MILRILLGAVSVAAGLVSAAVAATEPGGDASATVAAAAPTAELAVVPPTDYPDVRLARGYKNGGQVAFNPADPTRLVVGIGVSGADEKCAVKSSADGGRTWGPLVPLPRAAGSGSTTVGQARRRSPIQRAAAVSMQPIVILSHYRLISRLPFWSVFPPTMA